MTGSTNLQSPRQYAALPETLGAVEPFAGWEVDLPEGPVWWSEQALAILELPSGATPTVEQAVGLCAPPYRDRLLALFRACLRTGQAFDEEVQLVTPGGRRVRLQVCGRAVRAHDGALVRIQGALRDMNRPHPPGPDAPQLAARLASTLDTMSEACFTCDTAMRFTYLNLEAAHLLQRDRGELLGKLLWDEFEPAVGGPSFGAYSRALREQSSISFEEFYPPLGRWFEVRCDRIDDGLAVYFHDITEREEARAALRQANRALQMLSRCNHVVMHADSERELIDKACSIAVDVGGYRLAWVGFAADDDAPAVSIAACAGGAGAMDCLSQLPLRWSDDTAAAGSPVGLAILGGEPVVVTDLAHDDRFPASAVAAACGFGGAIYLALQHGGTSFGLLTLYTHGTVEGDADEIRLLRELADNLAFGIHAIRARLEQARIGAAVTKIAASVSNATGENFFEQLASAMAEAVGADGALVSRLLPTDPPRARTVIAVVDGARVADFEYPLDGSPCKHVLDGEHYVVSNGLDPLLPGTPAAALGATAYVGWPLPNASGTLIGVASVLFRKPLRRSQFVTATLQIFAARAAAELERQDADAILRTQASLLDKAQDAIIVGSMDGRVLFWNKSAERMYGWSREEALGRRVGDLLHDDTSQFETAKRATLETGHWSGEAERYGKGGIRLTVQVRLSLIKDDDGTPDAILSINTDITRRRAAEREIERLAYYDPTTSLPNRLLLLDRLHHALAVAEHMGATGALLFIDLDNFKAINDTLGHDKGDHLLRQVAARLRACVFEIDTVARLGGDEFVILVENLSRQRTEAATQARHVCAKILHAFDAPIGFEGFVRHITASIGVTLFDRHHCGPGELLKQADMAMYEVKAAGRNGVRFFDPEMESEVEARAALEADLRAAVQHDQFVLHFQPQVDRDGALTGAEVLIRWQSPGRGLVAPAEFIPVAEETGLIMPIGRWVLERACEQLARWALQPELAKLSLSVNVSACQLRQRGYVEDVSALLERCGGVAGRLKLEITESLLVEDADATIATMHSLKQRGVGFSLDDFGTGYSSLSYLKRLPLDQMKIDQSFVSNVGCNSSDAAIAQTIMELGRLLHLNVIAEGVETAAQFEFLIDHGCHAFQGFLFSRAVPVEQFEQYASRRGVAAALDPNAA